MMALAGSLYLVSTAAFAVVAGVVGIRLLLLSRRTGQLAERLLGLGLLLTVTLGYAVIMVGLIGRSMLPEPAAAPPLYTHITTAGWIGHNIGVTFVMAFVVHVFRHGVLWARLLMVAASITLWAGWAVYFSQGGMAGELPQGGFWIVLAIIGTYPLWTATESFLYYARMRKRVALGLGDQLVANRFLLWGLASLSTAAAIWVVNIPGLLGISLGRADETTVASTCLLVTGVIGTATLGLYWLTFFPPVWYQRRFSPEEA